MRDIIPKLNCHILVPNKLIITFDYHKKIGGKTYSKLLINNNEFHNKITGLLI